MVNFTISTRETKGFENTFCNGCDRGQGDVVLRIRHNETILCISCIKRLRAVISKVGN